MNAAALLSLAFLVLMPLGILNVELPGHDSVRIAQIALGSAATIWLAVDLIRRPQTLTPGQTAWVLLVLALGAGCVSHAAQPAMALREAAMWLGLAAVAAGIARADRRDRAGGFAVLAAMLLYGGTILLLTVVLLASGRAPLRLELFVGYHNYRFFNHVQTAALPLLLVVASGPAYSRSMRRLAVATFAGGVALLLYTFGRGTLLALAASALCARAVMGRRALTALRPLAAGTAGGIALYGLLFVAAPLVLNAGGPDGVNQQFGQPVADNSRRMLWRIALDHVRSEPWLGIGPMHYAHHFNAKASHPHNAYLQIAAEWGLPMLGLMVVAVGGGLARLAGGVRRCVSEAEGTVGLGLLMACVALVVDLLFSAGLVMPVPQVWLAVVVGWAAGWTAQHSPAARKIVHWPRGAGMTVAGALIALQVWMWMDLWGELADLNAYLSHVSQTWASPKQNPRFWSHGWF